MKKIRLAIIGCGKVTEIFHLPAAASSEHLEVVALVDPYLPQARALATAHNVPVVEDDYRNILGRVDAAIVATPHHLHGSVALGLLKEGIHVLVEKPMALNTAECDTMIKQAERSGLVLSVGLLRRYYEAAAFVKIMLKNQMLGSILNVDLREGSVFRWQSASDFMFRKYGGGGVMVDAGIHLLDTMLWWFGEFEVTAYYDDAMGGVEANAEIQVVMANGSKGAVELSRTRNLRNTCIIQGDRGSLEIGSGVNPLVRLRMKDMQSFLGGQIIKNKMDKNNKDVFSRQIEDFVQAILNRKAPFVPGTEGRRSVEKLETCYASKLQLHEPWMPVLKESL
ncbi:MAG: Gfo/Idh/MocA family oxidoreductase [Balneolales bacterium]